MPNYVLPEDLKDFFVSHIRNMSGRPAHYALSRWPFTLAQIQDHFVELDQDVLETLRGLRSRGVPVSRFTSIEVGFTRDILPELRRGVVLRLELPTAIYIGRQPSGNTTPLIIACDGFLHPRVDELEAEERVTLVKYLTNVVRQHRLEHLTDRCAAAVIPHLKTSGDLLHVWPGLVSLVDKWDRQGRGETWRARFRNPPSGRWSPSMDTLDLKAKWQAVINAADTVLLGAAMMPRPKHDGDTIRPTVVRTEVIEGDMST